MGLVQPIRSKSIVPGLNQSEEDPYDEGIDDHIATGLEIRGGKKSIKNKKVKTAHEKTLDVI